MHDVRTVPTAAMRNVVVAIPAYNEDRFIGSLVLKLRARDRRVLVVDDGSTDETANVAEAAGPLGVRHAPNLGETADTATVAEASGASVVRHSSNMGKTAAVATIFDQARVMDADALVLLD